MPETMPFDGKRLITKMLSVDPGKRPTAKEVIKLVLIEFTIVMPRQMAQLS